MEFSLINEFSQELFNVKFIEFDAQFEQAKHRQLAQISLREFRMEDAWIVAPKWTQIMETVPIDGARQQNEQALRIVFDQDREFKKCPFKVQIYAKKSCHAVANLQLMNEVMRTMSIAMKNEKLDFSYFVDKALDQITQMRKKAREYAENIQAGEYMHQNADIEAEIYAPVLILPQDIFDPYQRYIKVDLGMITVNSDLLEYDKKKDYKSEQNEHLVYD